MSTILAKQEQTDLAMIDIANSVHQGKENKPPPPPPAQPQSKM